MRVEGGQFTRGNTSAAREHWLPSVNPYLPCGSPRKGNRPTGALEGGKWLGMIVSERGGSHAAGCHRQPPVTRT